MPVPYHEASNPPPPPNSSQWGPYSGAGDFGANMIVILVVLFCGLFLALAVNAIIRYLLCADRRRRRQSDPEKPSLDDRAAAPAAESAPAQIFAAGTRLAGVGPGRPECAICLLELADGDRVRVLPACEHGFHAACVERWLRAKSSCPTCRTACQAPAPAGPAAGAAAACAVV